ncbi:hypothetical protein AK830_g9515 [Neonectria ditissima]|uniref:Protein kinase domain-containing protein n=1 Tax=Neonectria ditissima TaxID=78410 RepID=A0A0P7B8X8_9HYPO|nr:hypothetical protein AK830_g9515 [Neonectria ditissima]
MTPQVQVHLVPDGNPIHSPGSHPPLFSWKDDLKFPAKTQQGTLGVGSSAASTSDVNDLGDDKRLKEQLDQKQSHQTFSRRPSTGGVAFSNLGAGFVNTEVPAQSNGIDVSPTGATVEDNPDEVLGKTIRDAFQHRWKKDRKPFLPIDKLDEIVNHELVSQELLRLGVIPPTDADRLNRVTCQIVDTKEGSKHLTSRRKLFTILALINKVSTIMDFIDKDIYDNNLPFIEKENGEWEGQDEHGKEKPIDVFRNWRMHERESFFINQWKVHVPIFSLSTNESLKVEHFKLAEGTTLPWIEEPQPLGRGGFGVVEKVKIHPQHLTSNSTTQAKDVYYAVKQVEGSGDGAFKKEVSNLNRFSGKEHPNLIRLLCTFSIGDKHHLLFPCADGNLQELWKEQHKPQASTSDPERGVWFSGQCLGIVEGLLRIHRQGADRVGDILRSIPRSDVKKYGRHGDLKPENILWFRNHQARDEDYDMGLLKISDFGLMRFHGTVSMSQVDARRLAVSPTYRAPEFDISDEVSQAYDIWSLGCVLLEFVIWYLKGWPGVDSFSKSRAKEDIYSDAGIAQDIFFSHVKTNGQWAASKNKAVHEEFSRLYADPNCSDFIQDLLEFVEDKLLRIRPKNRARCVEIHKKLVGLHQKCKETPDYSLKHTKRLPIRSETSESELCPDASHRHSLAFRDSRLKSMSYPIEQTRSNSHRHPGSSMARSPLGKGYLLGNTRGETEGDMESRPENPHRDQLQNKEQTRAKIIDVDDPETAETAVPKADPTGLAEDGQRMEQPLLVSLPGPVTLENRSPTDTSVPKPQTGLQVPHTSRPPSSATLIFPEPYPRVTKEELPPGLQSSQASQDNSIDGRHDKGTLRMRFKNFVKLLFCRLRRRSHG